MMVDSLLHAQWRGSQRLLPCMAACLDADGWPSNKPNYFWFCMKLISMQGCWVAVCISNGFFFLFSFFLFLFSLLLATNTPRQMSIIFRVSVTFAELKVSSLRSGGKLPRQVSSCFLLDITRSGLHSLLKEDLLSGRGHKLPSSKTTLCWSVKGTLSEWKLH